LFAKACCAEDLIYLLSLVLYKIYLLLQTTTYKETPNFFGVDYTKKGIATKVRINYTTFGQPMPGRQYTSSNYRYGFNGKENDNEVKGTGNQQDYGMRVYDNRLGRFLSVDPLSKKFPFYTPYQFAGNKPIIAIDMDGLEEWVVIDFYQNNKFMGTSILHLVNAFRLRDHMNDGEAIHFRYNVRPGDNIFRAAGDITKGTWIVSSLSRSSVNRVFSEGLGNREKAILKGVKQNFNSATDRDIDGDITGFNGPSGVVVLEPNARNITFESNSALLTPEGKAELDNLVFNMKVFTESKYEISAHTDNVGNDNKNLVLSNARAASVITYLTSKGIDSSRLTGQGYGETQPVSTNDTDEGKANNRRVELKKTDKGYE
jgi:RHS repeat-associated protein